MNRIILITILYLASWTAYTSPVKSSFAFQDTFRNVKYVRNYDADTVTFNITGVHPLLGRNIAIRVYGVDTPEIRTKNNCEKTKAIEAKQLAQNILTKANRINLTNCKRGKYFRLVCQVNADGKLLHRVLLDRKLAYPYYGKTKKQIAWCNYEE